MRIDNTFSIGQTVYLKTDVEQYERIITSITIMPGGLLTYNLAYGDEEPTPHYDFEITDEREVK